MSKTSIRSAAPEAAAQQARRTRRTRIIISFAILEAIVIALIVWFLVERGRTQVRWTSVMAAMDGTKTVNGMAQVSGEDGTQWAYSLWVRVEAPGAYQPQGMLIPVRAPRGAKPSEQVTATAAAVDYSGADGIAARLARDKRSSRGRWAKWGGNRVLMVVLPASQLPGRAEASPDMWQFYLDPTTRLVQGLEAFKGDSLRARVEYRYNQPLPPGFASGAASRTAGAGGNTR